MIKKGKGHPIACHEGTVGGGVGGGHIVLFLTSMLYGMGSQHHAHQFYPLRKERKYPMRSWVGLSAILERCR